MKTLLFSLLLFVGCCTQPYLVFSQVYQGVISGKIYDQRTKKPLPYVTVSVRDSAAKLLSGSVSDEQGVFKLEGIAPGNYAIAFSYLGYQLLEKTGPVSAAHLKLDMGVLYMQEDPRMLKESVVTGEKTGVSLKLDKKVFEVGKDILSQSGAITDILNNVPAVAVSPTGTISLRGNSNVFVLINGRRSGLTQSNALEQIPADQVERIEIITNPSAQYDADGSAGIINIILKKNKKLGFTGQVRLAAGYPNDARINPSLNYKSEKINLFSTFGFRNSDYVGNYTSTQTASNKQLQQAKAENRHDDGKMLYLGADYFVNERNTITMAFLKNATKDHDKTAADIHLLTDMAIDSSLLRKGESWESRDYNQLEFNYTKRFKDSRRKLTVDMQYDFWNSDKTWQLFTSSNAPDHTILPPIKTNAISKSKDFLIKSDFTQPLGATSSIDVGIKAENRQVTSKFIAEQENESKWEIIDNIDNDLQYSELISSAYAQFNSKVRRFTYLLGLRAELTKIEIADQKNLYSQQKNYNRLFPTVHLGYQFKESISMQLSYSKRVNRPSLWLLYPFNELTDFNAQSIGNPALNPSYAHVVEWGFLRQWKKLTFNPSLYFHYTNDPLEDYTYRNDKGVMITLPVNIKNEQRRGVELSVLYQPVKPLQLSGEFNIYSFTQHGTYELQNYDFSGDVLTARMSAQVKLPGQLGLQMRYNFTGAQRNAQTLTKATHSLDVGVSKNYWKNKITVVVDGTNILNSRQYRTFTTGSNYTFNQVSNPNAGRYRVSILYKFNNKEGQQVRQAQTGNRS
jgi:Outer membrane protein beta-barrel family/CarboxypepD_reg-like domain/TonB-dependent Receptor Plug Domain